MGDRSQKDKNKGQKQKAVKVAEKVQKKKDKQEAAPRQKTDFLAKS